MNDTNHAHLGLDARHDKKDHMGAIKFGKFMLLACQLALNASFFWRELREVWAADSSRRVYHIVVAVESSMFVSTLASLVGLALSPLSAANSRERRRALLTPGGYLPPTAAIMLNVRSLAGFSALRLLRQLNPGQAANSISRYWVRAGRGGQRRVGVVPVASMALMLAAYLAGCAVAVLALLERIKALDLGALQQHLLDPLDSLRLPDISDPSVVHAAAFANQVASLVTVNEFEVYSMLLLIFARDGAAPPDGETLALIDWFMEAYYRKVMAMEGLSCVERVVLVTTLDAADLRHFVTRPDALPQSFFTVA